MITKRVLVKSYAFGVKCNKIDSLGMIFNQKLSSLRVNLFIKHFLMII